jgi:indolepyruvate ferredoxin oxidoreductase
MSIRHVDQKYTAATGQVLMTGIQALVRLPMLQQELDRAAGLNTAGYVTGYRGSPLGNVDQTMQKGRALSQATQCGVSSRPERRPGRHRGVGHATGQHVRGAKYDGVYAMWYGKGPGVDRSGDVIKHGNVAGTSAKGGVLLVAGDDHAAKSSTFRTSPTTSSPPA